MNYYLYHALYGFLLLAMDATLSVAAELPPPRLTAAKSWRNLARFAAHLFWPWVVFLVLFAGLVCVMCQGCLPAE